MAVLRYDTLASTNSEAVRLAPSLSHGDVVVCRSQTAGRGQRGNSWEAAPGQNLTFSIFLRPGIEVDRSFLISMAVAVAITEVLNEILAPNLVEIKWPNDIYCADRKLAGILIENSITGKIVDRSIVGIGLNVNQREFLSDAPNPVSMASIAGRDFELQELLDKITGRILQAMNHLNDISDTYHSRLWRAEGIHLWREPSGTPFEAAIAGVAPSGHLTLRTPDGSEKTYAFKEVFPVLNFFPSNPL